MIVIVVLTCLFVAFITKMLHEVTRRKYISDVKMKGKVVIITGSNTGIGYTTAEDLARRGAKVILACRDPRKGMAARDEIIQSTGNTQVVFRHLDLSSFQSVRHFAEDILKSESRLDVLINNAGTLNLGNYLTADNLPIEAQVNHFSPFLLTMLLLPLLKSSAPSRIINVTSLFYVFGNVDNLDKKNKVSWIHRITEKDYSNTKLANILFTKKLSEELKGTGVTANCLHPGPVTTKLYRNRWFLHISFGYFININVFKGAQTSIYLAVDPGLKSVSGKYFSNCSEVTPLKKARDRLAAEKLWMLSENIVKLNNCTNINMSSSGVI